MRRIMVMNLGSTSFKFKLFEMGRTESCAAVGGVENIGGEGKWTVSVGQRRAEGRRVCRTHSEALNCCLDALRDLDFPVDMRALDALGYKAVHGGSISGARRVDAALVAEMRRMAAFAPAHNPVYLDMMRQIEAAWPDIPQIACFETAFHATMPLERAVYGVPLAWAEQEGIRRYGFHGSSHSYIAWRMGQEAPEVRRLISVHLGGSCSLCAILEGKSVAASMGATPQSGVFHNNRVGDLDVFCLPALAEKLGGLDQAMKALASESGLLGLSGVSNDMRQVEAAAAAGDERAELAIRAFVDAIVGYIGMYTAYLGGLDGICFTGGIGLHDAGLRKRVAERLGFVGARLDEARNSAGAEGPMHAPDSGIQIWTLETNEELMVARGCVRVLEDDKHAGA